MASASNAKLQASAAGFNCSPHIGDASVDDRTCSMCTQDCLLTLPDHSVSLSCSDKHIYRLECLEKWCLAQGRPDLACCPRCRGKTFPDSHLLNRLKLSVRGKNFIPDFSRYTPWEDYERSCADLDKEFVESSNSLATCGVAFMNQILEKRHCPDSDCTGQAMIYRTLKHMDYTTSPEYKISKEAISSFARNSAGSSMPARVFFNAIMSQIHQGLIAEYAKNRMPFWNAAACMAGDQDNIQEHTMVPGFLEHLRRMVNRIIRFQLLRACDCTSSEELGIHLHDDGFRQHHNPDEYGLPRPTELGD